ncbi:MAG: hypothetical protein L6Q46_11490 [Flavobacterium sp.]|uniref:FEKKY domain-containing protein n=1 Tax=Flavobacterium sp. TaxID=239 RepID=UPI0025C59F87|nr:hypothetical protein [Flavobacterium sp.]MCK6608902.1 hypothetical protein [Flavobacterium sp.]
MNFKLIILVLLFNFTIQAQEKRQNDTIKIEINSKTKTIYVLGGIASVITKDDLAFSKKYNIQFHDFGCIAPTNFEEYEAKNALVFEYLNKSYGNQWQKEIKPSVIGFEKWKKK